MAGLEKDMEYDRFVQALVMSVGRQCGITMTQGVRLLQGITIIDKKGTIAEESDGILVDAAVVWVVSALRGNMSRSKL